LKSVFQYYFGSIRCGVSVYVWAFLTIGVVITVRFLDLPGEMSPCMRNSIGQLQVLLQAAWLFVGIQIPYWATHIAVDRRRSHLAVWWHASGQSLASQVAGQFLAVFIWPLVYCVLLVVPIAIFLLPSGSGVALQLVAEHSMLYLASAALLTVIGLSLGGVMPSTPAFLVTSGLWFITVSGTGIIRQILLGFTEPSRTLLAWAWGLLPQFAIFYRPGALLYVWPPLSLGDLFTIVGYAILYGFFIALTIPFTCRTRPE
jgi:hypothetical protein